MVEMFDAAGRKVLSQTANAQLVTLNVSDLQCGTYQVVTTTPEGKSSSSIILE
jgi:hypothetical protein